ncbi:MAG: hypothetical protein EHM45_17405 [Desulfobacteraceae bacterium]|nr:MAG: hypothetical protein EHM45_17405 [Desulfobacteraceae bacterium]
MAKICSKCGEPLTFRTTRRYQGKDYCPDCIKIADLSNPVLNKIGFEKFKIGGFNIFLMSFLLVIAIMTGFYRLDVAASILSFDIFYILVIIANRICKIGNYLMRPQTKYNEPTQ